MVRIVRWYIIIHKCGIVGSRIVEHFSVISVFVVLAIWCFNVKHGAAQQVC